MSHSPWQRWIVLASAFAIITLSIGTLFTLGVFLKPMEDGLGWSRSSIGAIGLLNWIVMGLGGVLAGYLSDRFGTRVVVLLGGVLLGLGLVLSSRVTEMWQLYATFGFLVGGGVSAFYVPLTVLAIKWFDDRRGLAAAIVSSGNGFGIMALSPLSRWLINEFDWRGALVILGDVAWLVVIPAALLLKSPPQIRAGWRDVTGSAPLVALAEPGPSSARSIIGSWPVWAIGLTHFACCAAHSGPDLPHGLPRDRPRRGRHDGGDPARALGPGLHRGPDCHRTRRRSAGSQADPFDHARSPGRHDRALPGRS